MLSLNDDHIDIWHADYNESIMNKYSSYFKIISLSEKRISDRFRNQQHQINYILTYTILRVLLSSYTGINPEKINFSRNKYDKPFISPEIIKFNLSHSNKKLIIAVSKNTVGVDIEHINQNFDIDEVLDVVLSQEEKLVIKALNPDERIKQFFKLWTGKEALLKAIGIGLNIDLPKIDIATNNKGKINNVDEGTKLKKWSIKSVDTFDTNYIASVAYKNVNIDHLNYFSCYDLSI